jgi:hypothetical protein
MPLLLHLTPEKNAPRIRRAGMAAASWSRTGERGLYCFPLLPSHTLTYQWGRELQRGKQQRNYSAVRFRVPDTEPVTVGHYNEREPRQVSAAEAVGIILALDDPRGYEIFLPRAVGAGEIRRVQPLGRTIGWRHLPNAHGRRPCSCCVYPGTYKAADVRRRFAMDPPPRPREEVFAALTAAVADPASTAEQIVDLLWELKSVGMGDAFRLAFLVEHPSAEVREELAYMLRRFRGRDAAKLLARLRLDPVAEVREAAAP